MAKVSDHAVLRYMERVMHIDVEAIRAKIAVPGIDTAAAFGCGTVKMGDGSRLRLRGDIVCTVIESAKSKKRRGR